MPDTVKAPAATDINALYQSGINYKSGIKLYSTVSRNERFFVGDSWQNVNGNLPQPNTNIIKRLCQQKIADVDSNKTMVQFSAPDWPQEVVTSEASKRQENNLLIMAGKQPAPQGWENPMLASEANCTILNGMFEIDWERLNMDIVNTEGLKDACISGDYILYNYFNPTADNGQANKGQIEVELIDNVNYYPGNPNEKDPQKQPYIILARREMVEEVKAQAVAGKIKQEDIDRITGDNDYQYQSGDMAQKELDDGGDGKIITLTYLWRDAKSGHICAQKSTKEVVIRKAWDTNLKRYPLAIMNWEIRKNSCHGRSEVTGLVANQKAINTTRAIAILSFFMTGQPKTIFNRLAGIQKIENDITKPIGVNGNVNEAVRYLTPPSLSADAYAIPQNLINDTLNMAGCSDVSIGNSNPTNANAMMLAINRSQIPIATIQKRYYALLKEFALNWLDMTLANFTESRWVLIPDESGKRFPVAFDPQAFASKVWSVHIEVGQAKDWQQNAALQQFAQMVQSGQLDAVTYLEMLPESALNNKKQKLIESVQQHQAQLAMMNASKGAGAIPNIQPQTPQIPQTGGMANG